MSDFQQTITSLNLLHTSLYRMELFMNAQAVKNAKTDVISLISRLEKAERERDELRAEIARRDAAAGEPVAVVDIQRGRGDGKKYALCYTSAGHSLPDDIYNLYTAALPAVLPDLEQDVKNIIGLLSENEWAEHCTKSELGRKLEGEITRLHDLRAQQQEVVELPVPEKDGGTDWQGDITAGCVNRMRDRCIAALDAANVKWEVKS